MKCLKCGCSVPGDSVFCPYCGAQIEQKPSLLCPTCAYPLPPDSEFCQYCGTALRPKHPAEKAVDVRPETEAKDTASPDPEPAEPVPEPEPKEGDVPKQMTAEEPEAVELSEPASAEDAAAEIIPEPEPEAVEPPEPTSEEAEKDEIVPEPEPESSVFFESVPKADVQPVTPFEPAAPQVPVHEAEPKNTGKKPRAKKGVLFAVLAVLLAAALGYAAVRYLPHQKPDTPAASEAPAEEASAAEENTVPTPTPVTLTTEQKLVAEAVKDILASEKFAQWQADYAKSTGKDPAAPEVSAVLHYQIGDFECYLVNVAADVRYADPSGRKTDASRFGIFIGEDGEEITDSITADVDNFDDDVSTHEGRVRYLLWAFANRLSGESKGNYLNDVEVRTEWSDEAIARINAYIQ